MHVGPGRRAVAVFFAMALGAGCAPRYEGPLAPPLLLERPAREIPSEPCEPSGEPGVPAGRTPPPVAQGELELLEVRGDDRLGLSGYFVSAWSSDGEHLITATEEGVLIWKTRTGELDRFVDLGVRLSRVHTVVVSPDGQWIGVSGEVPGPAPAGGAGSVWLLRASGESPAQRFRGAGGELRFTADSRRMLANGHAWELPAGTHTVTRPIDKETLFLPDGRRALVFVLRTPHPRATYVPELREIGSGQTLHRFPAVDWSVRVALSGDGQRVAVLNGALSVFSTETFERVALVTDLEGAEWVHLSHDGRRAAVETISCISFDGGSAGSASRCPPPHLAVWDLDRDERIFRGERGAGNGWVFTRDGRFLTGPETRLVDAIIRVEDGAVLQYGTRIRSISPDSRWVLFDAQSGLELASLDGSGAPPPLSRALRVLARSGDGQLTAGVGTDGMLRLEGPTTCVRLGMTTGVWRDPRSPYDHLDPKDDQVAFSPDGASLFTVLHDTSKPLFRAFRTSDGTERWSIRAAGRGDAAGYVLPGAGQVLFQGYERAEVRRFDATTGAELLAGHAPRVGYETPTFGGATFDVRDPEGTRASHLVIPAATRDGRSVATFAYLNNAFMISIWDLQDPRRVVDLPAGGLPVRLALSPDERWWTAGTMDGGIRLFPRQGGRPLDASSGHAGRVTALAFTHTGDRLASAAEDGTVVLVDTSNGAVVGRARLPLDRAAYLWVSPDGRELWAETARAMRVRFRIRR